MKKILFIFLLFGAVATISAQKQSAKKTPQNKQVTPPIKPKIKKIIPPPPPPPPSSKTTIITVDSGGSYPMVAQSSSQAKFDKEKVCTTCDTLVLEPGKPHIVIYDVKWLADNNQNIYLKQPTERDLKNSYYEMRGTIKREWDELQNNFPKSDFAYHHVYRSTFVKVPNASKENVNLLNRQDRHEGFVYWSGNAKDKIVQSKKMVQLTERVAKERAEAKNSSYVSEFKKDSLTVQNLLRTQNPDKNLQANMNEILQELCLSEELLPFAFLDLKNISKIIVASESDEEKTYSYQFNASGQLTSIDAKYENIAVAYKDNLPFTASKRGEVTEHFYYQNDVMVLKEAHQVTAKKLVGNVFMEVSRFETEAKDYEAMDLKSDIKSELVIKKGENCVRSTRVSGNDSWSKCYSNTQWKLPLTITQNYNDGVSTKTYSKNEAGDLLIESINPNKTTRLVFKLKNGTVTQIDYTAKRGDGDFGAPYVLNVKTVYFK